MRTKLLTATLLLCVSPTLAADEPITVSVSRSIAHPAGEKFLPQLSKLLSDEPAITIVPAKDGFQLGTTPSPDELREVGKRSGAKLHAQLEVTRTGELVGCTIFETGRRDLLADVGVSADEATLPAEAVAAAVRNAVAKSVADKETIHRVVRWNLDTRALPLASRMPAIELFELLGRRLSAADNIVVAQRREGAMPLSLTLSTGEAAEEIVVELNTAGEKTRVSGDRLDIAILEKLTEAVCKHLAVDPPATKVSVARVSAIADNLWAQGKKKAAILAAQQAAILAPRDVTIQRRLSGWLLDEVESFSREWKPVEQRTFVACAVQTERRLADDLSLDEMPTLLEDVRYPGAVHRLHSMMNVVNRLGDDFEADDLARLRADHFRCVTRANDLYHQAAARDANHVPAYSLALGHRMHYLCNLKPDAETPKGQAAVAAALRWLELFDELPAGQKPWNRLNIVLRSLTKTSQVRDRDVVTPLYRRLEAHPQALVQLFGRRGRMTHDWNVSDADAQAAEFHELRLEAMDVLDAARKNSQARVASETVRFLDESFNSLRLSGSNKLIDEMLDTADALHQRGIPPGRMLLDACALADESSAKRAYELLGEVHKNRSAAAAQFARLEQLLPELRKAPAASPVALKKLFDAHTFGERPLVLHPQVRGDRVYAMVLSIAGDTSVVQLIAAPLDGGEHELLGKITLPERPGSSHEGNTQFVTAACTDRNSYYAAIRGVGIVEFGLHKDRHSTLVEPKSLPQGVVQSLSLAGGQLYAGVEGGKLLRVKMMTGKADTLVATDVDVVKSPLDDRPPFDIPLLLTDEPRGRLLALVQDRHSEGRGAELWQVDLKTQKIERLERLGRIQLAVNADLRDDTLTLADTWLLRWNLKTDEKTIVANYNLGEMKPTRRLWISGLNHPVVCAGAMWWLQPDGALGRLTFPGGQPEIHLPDELKRGPADRGGRSHAFAIDEKRYLLLHGSQLWLATPKR